VASTLPSCWRIDQDEEEDEEEDWSSAASAWEEGLEKERDRSIDPGGSEDTRHEWTGELATSNPVAGKRHGMTKQQCRVFGSAHVCVRAGVAGGAGASRCLLTYPNRKPPLGFFSCQWTRPASWQ